MKNRKRRRGLSVFLTVVFLVLPLSVACKGGETGKTETDKKETGTQGDSVKIWSTYVTSTIFQDPAIENTSNPPEQAAELSIRMAKGETEGDQLILTPQYDVKFYMLEPSELVCGENKISTDQIKIYKQGYVYAANDETDFPAAKYPDILIPMEKAVEYGETTIEAGNNQGITVEVTTDARTKPGNYTGTFALDIDGKKTDIPVSVTVWDIDITESHLRCVDVAKYDTMQRAGEASTANIRNYYEDLLDYRMQITDMPFADISPKRFQEELLRYYDDPRVNSIGLPDAFGMFGQCLLAAARLSTPDKLYTDKLVCYDKNRDESWDQEEVLTAVKKYKQEMEDVISALEQEGFFDQPGYGGIGGAFYQRLTESIRDVKLIYTIGWNSAFEEYGVTYCVERLGGSCCLLPASGPAYFGNAEFSAYREYYENTGEWLHYANGSGPMIGSGLPNWSSALRYWGYAMYNMGVSGELTWGTTLYSVLDSDATIQVQPRNWYEDGLSFPALGNYMDGFYTYPGKAYGMDTFLPSVRLAARRDGFEDYELIYRLARLYQEPLRKAYGEDYDMNDVLDWVFRKAVSGWRYYHDDDTLLFEMRETIVSMILLAESDCGFMFEGIDFDPKQPNMGTMEFLVKNGYEVTLDAKVLSGASEDGYTRYHVVRDGNTENDFSIVMKGKEETFTFEGKMLRNTVCIGNNEEGGALKAAYTSTADSQRLKGTAASFVFEGAKVADAAEALALAKKEIRMEDSYFGCKLKELYDVTMTVELTTSLADKDVDMLVEIYLATAEGSKAEIEIVNLKANGTTKRQLTFTFKIDEMRGEYLRDYSALQFEMYPYYDASIYAADYYTDQNGKYADGPYHIYGDMELDIENVSWTKYGRAGE